MWWRAAAAGGVLAIYLLCVLLLSGLQKDDLDVNIIKKLQRHNINIDIIDNEEKRQECLQSLKNQNQNHSIEVKKGGRHNSFDKVNFTTKLVELPTEKVSRKASDTDATRIWTLLRRISTKKGKETKKTTTTTTEKPKQKSKSTKDSMEYISKIIESYLAMTKTVPTTTPTTVNFKGMMDEIKKLLAMNNYQQRELFRTATIAPTTVTLTSKLTPVSTTTPTTTTTAKSEVDTGLIKLLNIAINKFDAKTERPLRLMPPATPNQVSYEETTQEHTLKVFKKVEDKNANMTEVLVHDIAENVKDIVLKELKKDILTTTARYAVTRRTTANPESVKDVTMALAQFMEMFEKFKNVNDNVLEQRTQATTSNVINKPKELAVYRSPLNVQYKPIVKITAKKILPIGNPHIIQNIPINFGANIPPQPVRVIQRPQQQQQQQQQQLQLQQQEQQQIGYYNKSPMTVQQTNRDVIPPLKIPLESPLLVYQNIMITTERSFNRVEFKKHDYNIYEDKINKDYDKKLHSMINNYKPHELIREYANEGRGRLHGYKDYSSHLLSGRQKHKYGRLREVAKYKDISDEPPRWVEQRHGRNAYKYHEELERVDDYPRQLSRERHHKKIRKMKMSSRKLRPIHESKNHSRYDDTHFINFLKTQQKVNDMLERILATKTISDKPTSAETA